MHIITRGSFSLMFILLYITFDSKTSALKFGLLSGLCDRHVPPAEVVGPPPGPHGSEAAHGPGGPQPGQGHLEARGVLSECQRGQLPICHRAQCAHPNSSQRGNSLHSEVRLTMSSYPIVYTSI